MKLCVFDFDSTLMDGETIDFLAKDFGVGDEVAAITRAAMGGRLDFFEAILKRAELLKGMRADRAAEICAGLPLMNGAVECVKELKTRGHKVVIFSGGFHIAVDPAMKTLGADAAFANILHAKNGVLTGLVGGEMLFSASKGAMLAALQNLLGINADETAAIGDGANDLSMFAYAAVRIAFCAKEVLKKEANVIIEKRDLREVLPAI